MDQGADAGEMELPQAKVQCNSCVSARVPIIDIMCKYGLTITGIYMLLINSQLVAQCYMLMLCM